MPREALSSAGGVAPKPCALRLPRAISARYSALEMIRRSGSGGTRRPPASSDEMNAGSLNWRNSAASSRPANAAGSISGFGNTFRQPVAITRKSSVLAGALPWIRPSWLPREMYQGTSSPAARNGTWARSIRPG